MTQKQTGLEVRLRAFVDAVVEEARANPELAGRLEAALNTTRGTGEVSRRRGPRRRNPPSLDPFVLFDKGEDYLRSALQDLGLDQLKDIVAGYGMDRARLALRWRKAERLIELIVDTVRSRSEKGDAFRS